jgi:GxxExxY protein
VRHQPSPFAAQAAIPTRQYGRSTAARLGIRCRSTVGGTIVVELKAVKVLDRVRTAQSINNLKATGICVCLLLRLGEPRLKNLADCQLTVTPLGPSVCIGGSNTLFGFPDGGRAHHGRKRHLVPRRLAHGIRETRSDTSSLISSAAAA